MKKNKQKDVSVDIAFSASTSQALLNLKSVKVGITEIDLDNKFVQQIEYAENVLKNNYFSWVKSEQKNDITNEEFRKRINEYEKYVNEEREEELFQDFFVTNYFFLDARASGCVSKPKFGGELIPDIILFLPNHSYKIVELEKPKKDIFLADASRPTQEFGEARQQIRDYLSWAFDNQAYLREHGFPGMNIDNTSGLLVYGNSKEFDKVKKRKFQSLKGESKGSYDIVTFDEIIVYVNNQITNIEQLSE